MGQNEAVGISLHRNPNQVKTLPDVVVVLRMVATVSQSSLQ